MEPEPGQMPRSISVCFVCTGNICRSPTAEGILRSKLEICTGHSRMEVHSAGTHGYHIGDAPDPRSQAAALRRGYDLSQLRARRFQPDDFQNFDWVLALDRGHLAMLKNLAGSRYQGKLRMATCCSSRYRDQDVPDPYYGSPRDFELVLDMLEDAATGLVQALSHGTLPGNPG